MKFAIFATFCCASINTFAQVSYTVNPLNAGLFVKQEDKSNQYSGIIADVIKDFFKVSSYVPISDSYNDTLQGALDGQYKQGYIDFIAGAYYSEKNLRYLRYVPVPVAIDNLVISYLRTDKEKYDGLEKAELLAESDIEIIVIEGPSLGRITDGKNIVSYTNFKEGFDEVLKNGKVFIGSERMLRDYISKNPELKMTIIAKRLTRNNNVIRRGMFFAFNRDFLDLPQNKNVIKDLTEFLKNRKKL